MSFHDSAASMQAVIQNSEVEVGLVLSQVTSVKLHDYIAHYLTSYGSYGRITKPEE